MLRTVSCVALIALSAPAAAQTQQLNGCELGPDDFAPVILPALAGEWTVENGSGEVNVMGMTQPMAPEAPQPMTMTYQDGTLLVDAEQVGMLPVERLDRSGLSEDERGLANGSEIDRTMLGQDIGCGVDDLEAILFNGSYSEQGMTVTFQARYYVISENELAGNMRMHLTGTQNGMSMDMTGYRYLHASR